MEKGKFSGMKVISSEPLNKTLHQEQEHTLEKPLGGFIKPQETLSKSFIPDPYAKLEKETITPHSKTNIGQALPGEKKNTYQSIEPNPHGEHILKYLKSNIAHEKISQEAEAYQKNILADRDTVITLPDYSAAYKKLNTDRNKGWKLNPSDIADFYLLESFLQNTGVKGTYHEDTTNVAVLNAKDKVATIGKRLLVALAHEQLDEYDRFAVVRPEGMPDELKERVDRFYTDNRQLGMHSQEEESVTFRMNYYLSAFKNKLDQHATRQQVLEVLDDPEMFTTAVQILETQQQGRWKTMATAMRALLDRSYPLGDFISAALPEGITPEVQGQVNDQVEANREIFLIDRLINYVHNTGMMSARVTNYFPRAASLLLAHGLPQHERYLFYHSSFNYSYDTLSTHLRRGLSKDGDRDLLGDLTAVVEDGDVPREYEYGLLLEFGGTDLGATVLKKRANENPTPGRVYNLLQRVSHHDGYSRGRLNLAA